jgi:MFS family permease
VAAARSAPFRGRPGFTETAREVFALLRGTNTEKAADAAGGGDDRRAGKDFDANNLRILQSHLASALMRRRPFRSLLSSSPAFRILMFGTSISMFGSRISTVAFPMLVLHLYNSPFITGLVAFAAVAPSVLAYVPAGALVDRLDPRRVMLISETLRGLAVLSVVVALLVFRERPSIWVLILAMLAEEILEIFSTLADRRYLTRLMEREKIAERQASVEVRTHAVVLAGRPVGPFLFALNPVVPFLADTISFIASILSLLALRRNDEPPKGQRWRRITTKELADDIGQGFTWLKNDRRAWLTVLLMAGTSLVAQALILMFLVEAHSKQLSTAAIGVVLAASGAGGAAGAVASKFLPAKLRGYWLPIQLALWSVALSFLAATGSLSVLWSVITMFVLGFTGAIGNISFSTYLIANIKDDMIARVSAIGQLLAISACALGPVLGGAAIQHYGVHGAIQILLGIVLALALASLFTPGDSLQITRLMRFIIPSRQVSDVE